MDPQSNQIHIVGAGVSGLIAAFVLEENGYSPVILEASDRAGGRLKTEIIGGFQLDVGFQVLLTNYPAAQKYLNYDTLNLQKLKAGSCVFENGKPFFFGDPLRDSSILFSTLFSKLGTLSDKVKIAKLNFKLQKKSIEDIFNSEELTSKEYLHSLGLSKKIIHNFFIPFFTGIFLETELKTSSRMFEFVFKMFGKGLAVLPKGGIEEISKQLKSKLKKTTFHFNTKVSTINEKEIQLANGEKIKTNYTIVATEASHIIQNLKNQQTDWKSCQNIYFKTKNRIIQKAFIGLITNKDSLINNIFFHTSIEMKKKGEGELLSVTVVKEHDLTEKELIEKVKIELKNECNIEGATFLKMYNIPKALPNIENLQYDLSPSETKLTDHIFLAGDVLLNGSLNAAMLAGEKAALGVLEIIEKKVV